MVRACYQKEGINEALKAAKKLEASKETIGAIIENHLDTAVLRSEEIDATIKSAKELKASKEIFDSIVKKCVEKRWIKEARKAAKLAGRELTTEEIKQLNL